MSKKPGRDDAEFTHNEPVVDPLGEVYSEMVTPDIAEMNDHAEHLTQEAETEPEQL